MRPTGTICWYYWQPFCVTLLSHMNRTIKRLDPEKEFYFHEGCHIIEVSNSVDDPDASIACARVEPGVTTRWHRLVYTAERYVILEGKGRVEIGDHPATDVSTGDVVLIPAMTRQRISNTGNSDLVFLAICTPRFTEDVYEAL